MKNWLTFTVVPFLVNLLVRFIYLTNKKNFHVPDEVPQSSVIFAMWHGELLMQPYNCKNLKPQPLHAIISLHKDGRMISKTVEFLGVETIDGSSSKGGTKALINAIKVLKKGENVAITPDGPRGPRHSIANGLIALAQKTNSPIIAVNVRPSKYWQFNSWDKFIVPKPFGTIDFYASKPYNITQMDFEEARTFIQSKMMEKAVL